MAEHYERHRPEETALHRIVREHLPDFLRTCREETGAPLPSFVQRAFRAYLAFGDDSAVFLFRKAALGSQGQLPRWACAALLVSDALCASGEEGDYSELVLIWFQDGTPLADIGRIPKGVIGAGKGRACPR